MARIRFTLLLGAILATLLATGCATIPSSGAVGSAPTPAPPAGGGVSGGGLIVEGPQPGWNPEQVVSGFLLASASFAHHHATARAYLTAGASRLWQPGAQVTILASTPSVLQQTGRLDGQGNRATVMVSWQELATLDASGQYTARGGAARQYFALESVHGEWRIASVPSTDGSKVSHELLLPAALFRLDYAPRNLYFYGQLPAGQPNQLLVPAPVFAPLQSSDLVATLVNDLLHDPSGWLENGAVTAFPPGSRLRKIQVLPGPPGDKTAIVDIGLPRGTPRSTVQAMAAQLVWTLTSPAYSAALIQAVKLKINGRLWAPRPGDTVQGLAEYGRYMPRVSRPQNLYYVSTNGAVRMFGQQAPSVAVPGQAGTGEVPLSKIAVSLNGHYLAGVAATTVYTADLAAAAKEHAPAAAGNLHSRLSGTRFSTPSWDSAGDLWVAGRVKGEPGVWVIPAASGGRPVPVSLPIGMGPVTGLRVAPDGVRIALIVGRGASAHLMVGAITRSGGAVFITQAVPLAPGLTGPTALTWYNEDHLLAITQSANGTRLWEVPVNGDLPIPKSPQPDMVSITAAGPQNALYAGVSGGRLLNSVSLGEPFRDISAGSDATYPG
jgi:Lipoprotein LpqB beta-propeller domain/Sporulation and spore germination